VVNRPSRDAASRLLAGVVRLLPPGRREWGRAMRAELAGIESGGARREFALGCVRAVVTQPAVLHGFTYLLLVAGVVIAALAWTATIAYAPLHWGLVGLVMILVVVSWLGRRRGWFGPVGEHPTARLVRAGGYLLVAAMAVQVIVSMKGHGNNPDEQARFGAPIFTVVLTSALLAFLAVTARASAATTRVLTTGAGAGASAAMFWMATALLIPPISPDAGGAVTLTAIAAIIAASANAGWRGSPVRSLLAALAAGTAATLSIFFLVTLLASVGPASLIPDLAPAALTPADDLEQSRIEIIDPFVSVLLLGCLLAIALTITSIATRRRTPTHHDQPAIAATRSRR
jgi:hypothetical protein